MPARKAARTRKTAPKSRNQLQDKQLPSSECLALCPFIDFFNHTIEEVSFT